MNLLVVFKEIIFKMKKISLLIFSCILHSVMFAESTETIETSTTMNPSSCIERFSEFVICAQMLQDCKTLPKNHAGFNPDLRSEYHSKCAACEKIYQTCIAAMSITEECIKQKILPHINTPEGLKYYEESFKKAQSIMPDTLPFQ